MQEETVRIKYTGTNFQSIQRLISNVVQVKEKNKDPYLVIPAIKYDYICYLGQEITYCYRNGFYVEEQVPTVPKLKTCENCLHRHYVMCEDESFNHFKCSLDKCREYSDTFSCNEWASNSVNLHDLIDELYRKDSIEC